MSQQPPVTPPKAANTNTNRRVLTLDVDLYQHMLDAPDLTQDAREKMLEALWDLVVSFIDLDYNIVLENSCGTALQDTDPAPEHTPSVLNSAYSNSTNSNAVADTRAP